MASAALLLSFGCAGGAWDAALREDTPASYYRYMRDHPDGEHASAAQERIDFHKVKRNLTLLNYRWFEKKYPHSILLDDLQVDIEPMAFEGARAAGSAEAYRDFVVEFPHGQNAKRAEANALFLASAGFGGDVQKLARFAADHPESDFAAEARRSVEATREIEQSRIRRVALVVRIDRKSPEPKRLTGLFTDAARKAFDGSGVELLIVPAGKRAVDIPTLTIEHREVAVSAEMDGSDMSRSGWVAQTRLTVRPADRDAQPVFQRTFELKVDEDEHVDGRSVLFGKSGPVYWSSFFVPVSKWASNQVVRPPVALAADEDVVSVDAAGDRAVVLYEDGRFDLLELSDPLRPVVLTTYQRPRDFKKYSDVRIVGDRIVIFGEDGIELIEFTPEGPVAAVSRDRGDVGAVLAFAPYEGGFVIATATGLYWLPSDRDQPERLMRRVIRGMDVVGRDLVLTDGETVYVTNIGLIRQKRVKAQLKLGKTFSPGRVRAEGKRAVVIGKDGIVAIDLRDASKPKVTAKIHNRRIGRVLDATHVAHRIFLIGDRGLLVMDPRARTIVETVDLQPRARVATMGRHVVAVGEGKLQVMDATPWLGSSVAKPAAKRR